MKIKKAGKRLLKLGQQAAQTLGQEGKERVKEFFANAIEVLERELQSQQGAVPSKKRAKKRPARRATRAKAQPAVVRSMKKARPRAAPGRRRAPPVKPSVGAHASGKPEAHAAPVAAQMAPRPSTDDEQLS